ncbi:glucan biosynthesis protein [Methylocystis bryophila]|uniref:Glucan biosynthesis protein D n=1 Tax=Methylocystis bryophila TaxID=655015 RepID=A0A1W6MUZ1_9HYPH|nr:glucan biosynthesis protein [Methylocystis bryophila]ARN81421.1 glucan biosynthesis protein D [Methylocystis bryophila]
MVQRRELLRGALGALAAAAVAPPGESAKAQGSVQEQGVPFTRDGLLARARDFLKQPFAAPSAELPDYFARLTREQFEATELLPEARVWASERKNFTIEPLLRGWVYGAPVKIFLVDGGKAELLRPASQQYSFGSQKPPDRLPESAFAGFRVWPSFAAGQTAPGAACLQFLGANFYRAKAAGQRKWGVTARGLSIRTADPGEEYPVFREFYVETPPAGEDTLVIHALLDSASVVGVYTFTLRTNEATILDVELTLLPRVELDHIGLASLAGASFFTPLDQRRLDDIRPAASEMNGLQIHTGGNEWLWRPLSNRNSLQFSSFIDANPKGFGFLTRNRDIAAYQDDDEHWEQRPSIWIEPHHDWGEGSVQLVEIPSESELNQNIVAYWRPKDRLAANSEKKFAYRQFWCWSPPTRPPLAVVSAARSGRGALPKHRRFVVVFSGEALGDPARPPAQASLSAKPGSFLKLHDEFDPASKTHRVVFELDPNGETFSELRLELKVGEEKVSESWIYRWTL